MSNSEIFNFQNTKENQSIIVAQHFEYKSAKKISFILLCVSVVVPIIINVLITLDLDNVMLGVLALISIITLMFQLYIIYNYCLFSHIWTVI